MSLGKSSFSAGPGPRPFNGIRALGNQEGVLLSIECFLILLFHLWGGKRQKIKNPPVGFMLGADPSMAIVF